MLCIAERVIPVRTPMMTRTTSISISVNPSFRGFIITVLPALNIVLVEGRWRRIAVVVKLSIWTSRPNQDSAIYVGWEDRGKWVGDRTGVGNIEAAKEGLLPRIDETQVRT